MMKIEKVQQYLHAYNVDAMLIESPINRQYVTGFTGTFGSVLITKDEAIFITDFRYIEQAQEQAKGFRVIENRDTATEIYEQAKKRNVQTIAFEEDLTSYKKYMTLSQYEQIKFVPVSGLIEDMRKIKTVNELENIKFSAKIADIAFDKILKDLKPGVSEKYICNKLEMYMREAGANSSAFDMIIASGYRSALPHGVASDKLIEKGDMVTLDFGALYKGYRSDMTRTVAVGKPEAKLEEIYHIVNDALSIGINCIKDGASCSYVDTEIRDYITKKGFGKEFGHGAGHSFGLEIHESPYFSKSSEEQLQSGMVMTIEPGIYIPNLGGVRIEDDVLVTDSGCEILTQSPKELIVL